MGVSGLRVIIVGAGFAGLTAAIECKLRGMHPILVESYPTSKNYGDIIDFLPNGGIHIQRWDNGKVVEKLLEVCLNDTDKIEYLAYDGRTILEEPFLLLPEHKYCMLAGHRGEMHQIICDYATEIGVEMRFGSKVVQYLDTAEETGVVLASGEKIVGDVVVGSDGPKSLARDQLLGLPESRVNSGYAIYRAYYTLTEEHKANPYFSKLTRKSPNVAEMWIGSHIHGFIYTWKEGTTIGWVLTHKDTHDIGESWSFPGKKEDALAFLDEAHFSEQFKEIVRYTPPSNLVDYKLVWRDPLKTWISPSARGVVIGDAAHCHLPTSAQGGCQAIEDGVALAICLERAEGDIPLALKVFERIRFNRSHVIHQSSITNRDTYHMTDLNSDYLVAHPELMNVPRPNWVVDHDARENAEKHFDKLAADVKSGRQGTLEELSLPADGNYEDQSLRVYTSAELPNASVTVH